MVKGSTDADVIITRIRFNCAFAGLNTQSLSIQKIISHININIIITIIVKDTDILFM